MRTGRAAGRHGPKRILGPHHLLDFARARRERHGPKRRGVRREEASLACPARNGAAADSLARGREAGTRRNDRQPAVDHVPALESRHANRALIARDASCPEAFCRDPADRAADVRVGGYPSHVRANHPVAALESSIRLVRDVIDVRDVGDIRHVHHRKAVPASPPREEGINGTKRAPAERTEAPAEPPAEMMEAPAETEERNVSRTPGRVVVRRHITRPPVPLVVPIYPAAVVIGRPAPRLVRDPCPAVIGVPNPPTVSVWGPVVALIGLPYVTVVGHLSPAAMVVQGLGAGVIVIGVPPARSAEYFAVAVFVPPVPIVFRTGARNLILGIVGALDCNELPLLDGRAALRHSYFCLAADHRHLRLVGGIHLDAVGAFLGRMHGHVGRVNFRVRFAAFEYRVVHRPLRKLDLNARARQIGDGHYAILIEPENVGEVELHFRAGMFGGRNFVAAVHGRVHRGRHPLARVAALGCYVPIHNADARHAFGGLRLRLPLGWLLRRRLCLDLGRVLRRRRLLFLRTNGGNDQPAA